VSKLPFSNGLTETVGRRTFLRVIGSAAPAAAISACSPLPPEKIISYVIPPEDIVPGVATWYASVCGECPNGCGTLVKTREGRAIKIEGNPSHPINRGSLCIRGQAALQGLYGPDRFKNPLSRRTTNGNTRQSGFESVSWEDAEQTIVDRVTSLSSSGQGDRIAVVTPLLTGTLDTLVDEWTVAVGGARRLQYETFAYEAMRKANHLVFDRESLPIYDFSQADVIVSFGADFLETWLSTVSHARDYADAKRIRNGRNARHVHLESRLSLTASNADEWIDLKPGTEGLVAAAMVNTIITEGRVQVNGISQAELEQIHSLVAEQTAELVATETGVSAEYIVSLSRAFSDPAIGPGRTLAAGGGVSVNGTNATETQVAIALLNFVAGNIGATIKFMPETMWNSIATYRDVLELTNAMREGKIDVLILHDVNPMFTLPSNAGFAEALDMVSLVVATSSHPDETTARADLVLPTHTPLESWGDHKPASGLHGLMQPAMRPLHDTRHFGDVLLNTGRAIIATTETDDPDLQENTPFHRAGDFFDRLRDEWRTRYQVEISDSTNTASPNSDNTGQSELDFEAFWTKSLREGGVWETIEPDSTTLSETLKAPVLQSLAPSVDTSRTLTLVTYPSLHFFDGRGANRPWLQEIPDPLLKTTWSSWVEMTPDTAANVGAEEGQLVTLTSDHGNIDATVLINPHLRDGVAAIPIGQGHTHFGRYASGRGVNPIQLLNAEPESASGGMCWTGTRIDVTPLELRRPVPRLQRTFDQQERELAQAISVETLAAGDVHHEEPHLSLNPEHEHPNHRWGMAIDLNACNGCNACVAACYAENNIPVTGAEQMLRGRTMSWLRIERFVESSSRESDARGVDTRFLPMLCQHCDHAPCETVCPTFATYHTDEGLNAQVYNRCVGTRYCANNCPYKVRRFNWFDPSFPEPLNLQLNPDVTARSAGTMEKCTFCVQRIHAGKDQARDEDRNTKDGDITPACAQTCPAQAIVFGDLNDPTSRVSQLTDDDRRYRVLSELNTRPAVTYLKKVVK